MSGGEFKPDGLSEEEIFSKYAERLGIPPPKWGDVDVDDEAYQELFRTVLYKSCSTNEKVDAITSFLHRMEEASSRLAVTDQLRSVFGSVSHACPGAPGS